MKDKLILALIGAGNAARHASYAAKDLGRSLRKMDIINRLQKITDHSVFANAIREGVKSNPTSVIDMIRDQAKDNRELVAEIIGQDLLTSIESL